MGGSIPERAYQPHQAAKKGAAVTRAENVLPAIKQIRAGGASLRQIAAELNACGIKTTRGEGGEWHASTVRNILTASNRAEVHSA